MSDSKKEKRPYERPKVRRVELRPEEAVLGSCKNTGILGPAGGNCSPVMGGCSIIGS